MKWEKGRFWITDDSAKVDVDFYEKALRTTYWAAERPRRIIELAIHTSIVLSVFDDKTPVGFARIVSDRATFAWICDVYIDPVYRGKGLGKWLMECTLKHPSTHVRLNLLATRDAHELYEKYDFERYECMVRRSPE